MKTHEMSIFQGARVSAVDAVMFRRVINMYARALDQRGDWELANDTR